MGQLQVAVGVYQARDDGAAGKVNGRRAEGIDKFVDAADSAYPAVLHRDRPAFHRGRGDRKNV